MEKIINVAIIGTGFGAIIHLPGYTLHKNYKVVGILGRSYDKTKDIAKRYNIKAYASLDEVVKDDMVDLVSIASIPCEHYTVAEQAILNNKHVILEKPMCMNSEETLKLLNLANQKKVFHAIVHEHRFDSARQYLKHIINEKVFGELRSIEITKHMTYWNDIYSGRNYDWFSDKKLGGGMIGAHLSHQIDFLNYIEGKPIRNIIGRAYTEVKKRYCKITNEIKEHTADDSVYAIAETYSGKPALINISASRFSEMNQVKVYTSGAEIYITGQNDIKIFDKERNTVINQIPYEFIIKDFKQDFRLNTFVYFLEKFYMHYIDGEKQDITSFKEGHNIQTMLDKIEVT
jgi:predicted dehydrogenase